MIPSFLMFWKIIWQISANSSAQPSFFADFQNVIVYLIFGGLGTKPVFEVLSQCVFAFGQFLHAIL